MTPMIDWFYQLDPNTQSDFWVVTIGAMTNAACALLGCYLVLRRMSLLGDAISHAVLPGLVVAFILSGSVNIVYMLIGALIVGLLTTVFTELLHTRGGVSEDASMGVVFTSLFALGVILIKRYGQSVDLDPDCVLYGLLEFVGTNTISIGGYEVPRAMVSTAPVLFINIVFIVVFWKELLIASFDPALATTMGLRSGVIHYLLMALVALTTVASFEQVGSILVVAMLIVPGAAAHLLCDRLRNMLLVAVVIGIASAVLGHMAAVQWNVNTAGSMAVVAGLFYVSTAMLSPRYGVLSTLAHHVAASLRIVREDMLAMLYRLEELAVDRPLGYREVVQAVGGGVLARLAVRSLLVRREICRDHENLRLTESGRRQAVGLVRSHRLWEVYLIEKLGLPPDHVHEPAMRMEHYIGPDLQQQLAAETDKPALDPHGREIPEGPAAPGS